MEARRHYEAAQNFIDAMTETKSEERHQEQRRWPQENRAQRRERERQERRTAKKVRA